MSGEKLKDSWEDLKKKIPAEYFVDKVDRRRDWRPEVCIVVLREVVDPVLARSSDSERAELFITKDSTDKEIVRARVNGEKFTSVERLTGLNICRVLNQIKDHGWDIISPEYLYNEIVGGLAVAINPDTVTYGAAGVEKGETFSIKSRVIEGYTYTLEPYNLLNKEQHNALYETGTMMKVGTEEGVEERGRGLYAHVNIEPPTKMVHFVRVEAPTKEMFLYVLHNILNTTSYFARSTRKGSIRNIILGIIFSRIGIGLSSGELIKEKFSAITKSDYAQDEVLGAVKSYVQNHKNIFWKILWDGEKEFLESIAPLIDVALLKDENSIESLRECLKEMTTQAIASYIPPEKEKRIKKMAGIS